MIFLGVAKRTRASIEFIEKILTRSFFGFLNEKALLPNVTDPFSPDKLLFYSLRLKMGTFIHINVSSASVFVLAYGQDK